MTVILETERLVLRELTDEDHARLYEIYQDPEVSRFIGGPPPAFDEYMRRVHETWPGYYRKHGFSLWAVERKEDGEMMGRIGLLAQEVDGAREVEVGYALGAAFQGRGYATEAARACRDRAFRTLGVPRVISLIAPENAASIRVAERNGMTVWKAADCKGFHVHVYRITREAWRTRARVAETGGSGLPGGPDAEG